MAKKKSGSGDNFLLEKGEKVGLGIGAGIGLALMALGLMSLTGGDTDPEAFAKALDSKASQLNTQMASKDASIPDIAGPLQEKVSSTPVVSAPTGKPYYDPTAPPDGRRITPIVLAVNEAQADIAVLKILANDFVLERDSEGNVTKVRVGVVQARDPMQKADQGAAGTFVDQVKGKLKGKLPPRRRNPMAGMMGDAGMVGGSPGGMGFPGAPGGGLPGARAGMGLPGGMGGATGFSGAGPGIPGGMGEMYGGTQTAGERYEVTYIEGDSDEEIDRKMAGRRLAITLRPQRMNVIQASFPYREQLVKFQQALRYQKLEELYARPDDMPIFHGVDVQRRLYRPRPGGQSELVEDWTSIDLAANSQDLRAVKLFYKEDPADLKRVMLHEDHMLVMPLPHELAGKYPDMRLKSIKDSIEKMKKQDAKGPTMAPPPSRYKGEGNPFKMESAPNASLYNTGEGTPLMPGIPKMRGGAEMPMGTGTVAAEPPDHIYVRVYDADVRDGLIHEYRVRVKLNNPNFGKHDLVSKKSDADTEELPPLDEHWYVIPQKVSVPQGGYHYVIDPTPPGKAAYPLPQPRDGQAVLQFQRWYEYLDLSDRLREPIGDWVLSELLATRGQYITGKAFSPLPFWSSVDNTFVLREIPGDKPVKGKDPRKGVLLEPVRPKAILTVDVTGGKARARIAPNVGERTNRQPTTEDEAAYEVLFLYPDGTLDLRTSAKDKPDPERKTREEAFKAWVKDTEARAQSATEPKKGNQFD